MSDTPKQPEPNTEETQSVKKPEETKSTPPLKPKNHGASVFTYLAILFAAAFLMLLLAYFIQQRNNDVALDHLRDSITSYQSLDQLIEENQALDDENQRLTQELENYYKVNGIFDAGMLGKQQQLLDDLIRPKQNSPEYFHDRCAQLNIPYQGTFRIGLVQCESSTLFKVSHISNQLRAHCPLANYGVFQYGSSVIILFRDWNDANVRTQSGFSEDWNALLTTLRQNKACMGISLLFSDVTKLYVGYRQAEAASNIGKRRDTDGTAYFYSKYYLEDMLEHYADTMPLEDTYTHYLDRLMDDNNSVCSNIKLLYYFLCSERNISLTAKHVHMHRNSVI